MTDLISQIIQEAFPADVMGYITSDHHKNRDGSLDIGYNYYTDDYYIVHEGYVRDRVEATGKSLQEAAEKFIVKIRRANNDCRNSMKARSLENQ